MNFAVITSVLKHVAACGEGQQRLSRAVREVKNQNAAEEVFDGTAERNGWFGFLLPYDC